MVLATCAPSLWRSCGGSRGHLSTALFQTSSLLRRTLSTASWRRFEWLARRLASQRWLSNARWLPSVMGGPAVFLATRHGCDPMLRPFCTTNFSRCVQRSRRSRPASSTRRYVITRTVCDAFADRRRALSCSRAFSLSGAAFPTFFSLFLTVDMLRQPWLAME